MNLHTRSDFLALAGQILTPLRPLYSPGGTLVHVGETGVTYPPRTIGMEAFSRPLWALGPLWAAGGDFGDLAALYRAGLAAGTDPNGPEYWGNPNDYDQLFVEMAAIACAMLEAPQTVWQPLPDKAKRDLTAWLGTINAHGLPHCNWLFFRVLVNLALDAVGAPYSPELLEQDLDEIDSWYVGDGWYTDGTPSVKPQRDYYIPWALQYYGVLYSVFAAERDPARAQKFRSRALAFGKTYARWFDTDGAALPYGRSLTYRFGQCAFYAACVWAGLEPLPLPAMKGIIVRNLQWWMQKPIFDRDGVLTIGYCYPQLYMSERYNAPGSPYWGLKSFILLALPESHPFWAAVAAPLPAQYAAPGVWADAAADLLMQRLPNGGVNAYAPAEVEENEHGQFAEKYGKFVYSTRFGFSASRSYVQLEQAAPDSTLAFVIGGQVFVRRHSLNFRLEADRLISTWSPFPGVAVTTELVPAPNGHTRRHTVESGIACTAYDCAFAVPKFTPDFAAAAAGDTARAFGAGRGCAIQSNTPGAQPLVLDAWPNTSLYTPNTVIPAVRYDVPAGTVTLACTVTEEY